MVKTYLLPAELRDEILRITLADAVYGEQLHNLPEAKFLDLSNVEHFMMPTDYTVNSSLEPLETYVRYSDLTAAVQTDVAGLVEALEKIALGARYDSEVSYEDIQNLATAAMSAYREDK